MGGDAREPEGTAAPLAVWAPDRGIYIRDSLWLAAVAMVGATLALYLLGNPDYWIGAVGGCLAIGARNAYLASEELAARWTLTADALADHNGRRVPLGSVKAVRRLGSAVQVVTEAGDKMLLKYLSDPTATADRLRRAAGLPS